VHCATRPAGAGDRERSNPRYQGGLGSPGRLRSPWHPDLLPGIPDRSPHRRLSFARCSREAAPDRLRQPRYITEGTFAGWWVGKRGRRRLTVPLAQLGGCHQPAAHRTKGPSFSWTVPVSVTYGECRLWHSVERNGVMTRTEGTDMVERIIGSGREAEEFALEAVRKFLDTVNGIFPDLSEDGPRRKIIDSAFKMTEQLVGTWTQAAEKIVKATGEVLAQPKSTSGSSK
jgi:hypothetical protein